MNVGLALNPKDANKSSSVLVAGLGFVGRAVEVVFGPRDLMAIGMDSNKSAVVGIVAGGS